MHWHKRRNTDRRDKRRRGRGFEQFESRRLMAVTTSLNSGTLTVTGDAAADDIAIIGTGNPGEITVIGRNGTEVNGVANGSVTVPGVTDDLDVNLLQGNDVLTIDNVYLAGDLFVHGSIGNNSITLGASHPVSTAGNLIVNTGTDNDVIQIGTTTYNVFAIGTLWVHSGAGFDNTSVYGASSQLFVQVQGSGTTRIQGVTSGGDLLVGGPGDLDVRNSAASGPFHVGNSGSGRVIVDTNYSAHFIELSFSARNTSVTIARCQAQQINVFGSAYTGNSPSTNLITIYGNYIVGPPYNFAYAHPLHPHTESLYINFFGVGNDNYHHDIVDVRYNVVLGEMFAQLADGDDTLMLVGNRIDQPTRLDGGYGTNRLSLGYNDLRNLTAVNFV